MCVDVEQSSTYYQMEKGKVQNSVHIMLSFLQKYVSLIIYTISGMSTETGNSSRRMISFLTILL